jgi:hypothetical protein
MVFFQGKINAIDNNIDTKHPISIDIVDDQLIMAVMTDEPMVSRIVRPIEGDYLPP